MTDDSRQTATAADMPASPRRWVTVVLVVATLAGAAALGSLAVLVLTSGSNGAGSNTVWALNNEPKKGTPYLDAIVVKATSSSFDLQTQDKKRHTVFLRAPDAPYIDVQHAQSHAALGQPVRVFTKTSSGKPYAIYLEDAPVIF